MENKPMTANSKRQPAIFLPHGGGPVLLYGLDLGSGRHLERDAALSGGACRHAARYAQGAAGGQRPLGGAGLYGQRRRQPEADLRLFRLPRTHLPAHLARAGRAGAGGTRGRAAERRLGCLRR